MNDRVAHAASARPVLGSGGVGTARRVLLLKPGGPGGSGLWLPQLFVQMMPQSVLDRYDLIGFDPRGVGHSTPVSCGLTAEQQDVTLVNPMPSPDGSIDANTAYAQAVANECANGPSAGEFPFMTTANTARDMG